MPRRRKHEYIEVDAKVSATALAEHGRDWSTFFAEYPHGRVVTCVPNYDEQQLVGIMFSCVRLTVARGENGREVADTASPSRPTNEETRTELCPECNGSELPTPCWKCRGSSRVPS